MVKKTIDSAHLGHLVVKKTIDSAHLGHLVVEKTIDSAHLDHLVVEKTIDSAHLCFWPASSAPLVLLSTIRSNTTITQLAPILAKRIAIMTQLLPTYAGVRLASPGQPAYRA